MTGKWHRVLGVMAGIGASAILYSQGTIPSDVTGIATVTTMVSAYASSVLPDIDLIPDGQKWGHLTTFLAFPVSSASLLVSAFIDKILRRGKKEHRAITHSLTGLAIFTASALIPVTTFSNAPNWIISSYIIGGVAGYLSHLVGDMFTGYGISWFYPFKKKRSSLRELLK